MNMSVTVQDRHIFRPSRRTTTSSQNARPSGVLRRRLAGPMAWNALPDDLRDPSLGADFFRKTLKTHLFRNALGHLAHRGVA